MKTDARQKIIDFINDNDLRVGAKLPPEAKLSKELSVSILTLRESLNILKGEGFLSTIHGRGTFITSDLKHISDTLNNSLGITEMIQRAGFEPGARDFERKLVRADNEISEKLKVKANSDVLMCRRVRTADGKPVVYSIDYFAPHLVPGFLKINDDNVSIYKFMEEENNIKIDNSIAEIIPYKCDSSLAEKLEFKEGEPLLKLKQTTTDKKGNPLIFALEYLRPDCFKIIVNRRRKS
jgi:GntR family transcriptional regulator